METQGAPNFGSANMQSQAPLGTNDRAPALFQPSVGPGGSTLDRSTASAGFVSISNNDTALARPWWTPPSIFDEWEKHFKRGNEGLYNFLFNRRYGSGGGRDEDACERRLSEEERRCYTRAWRMPHPDYLGGCLERAKQRWSKCLENGYPGGPGEVKEWGDEDEETWRNFGR